MSAIDTFTIQAEVSAEPSDTTHHHKSLRLCVETALQQYFLHLDGQPTNDLYQLVLTEVEEPLLEAVLSYTATTRARRQKCLA